MSHFSVIVITPGPRPPDEDADIAPLLQPYHEFECTGTDDQYVKDVDETEEARAGYESDTVTRLKSPNGELHPPYDAKFYREPTAIELKIIQDPLSHERGNISHDSRDWEDGRGYRPKVRFVPDGWEEVEVPRSSVETFAEYCESYYGRTPVFHGQRPNLAGPHKYGYTLLDANGDVERVINRTNPDKTWDWWVVGGRWDRHFTDREERRVNTIRRGDWDLDAELARVAERYGRYHDDLHAELAKHPPVQTWDAVRAANEGKSIDEIRKLYWEQPGVVAAKEVKRFDATPAQLADDWDRGTIIGHVMDSPDDWLVPRERLVAAKSWSNVGSYAICDANGWHSKGTMGWFGMSHDESDDWPEKALGLIRDLPEDAYLTLVDCHI